MKNFIALCSLIFAFSSMASEAEDYKTRIEWVKELKSFVVDFEQKNSDILLTTHEKNLLHRFSLFEEAIASGNYDCFFAGWPSTLVKSNGKRLCQNPSRGNSEYKRGNCRDGQLQCQPVIFGKNLCVGFSSTQDKQMAFARCDAKFKQKGNYNFLKNLSAAEKAALKDVSNLAHKVCVDGSVGVQKSKPMCKSLMSKFKGATEVIDRAPAKTEDEPQENTKEEDKKEEDKSASTTPNPKLPPPFSSEIDGLNPPGENEQVEVVDEEKKVEPAPAPVIVEKKIAPPPVSVNPAGELIPIIFDMSKINPPSAEACEEENVVVDRKVATNAEQILKTVNHEAETQYEKIKNEFQSSALCAPEKVLNDPKDKLSPVLFEQLMKSMLFVTQEQYYPSRESKLNRFKQVADEYGLGEETQKYGLDLLSKYENTNAGRFDAMARLRGVMLQEMEKNSKSKEGYLADKIADGLIERGIFQEDDDGKPECPFVSEDAFKEALAGREAVLKSANGSKLTNPDQITIVDYSRPSNERRMYVIDLKTNKVLHNTFVAHGGGSDYTQGRGIDDKGSSPQTSNAPGSNLSSEGFYIAKSASAGGTYLNNVILEGIDSNNSNLNSRAVVVHGWRTPNHEYVNKTWEMSDGKAAKRLPGKDIYREYMNTDFKNTKADLFDLSQDVKAAASGRPYMDATEGCLGVPDTKMGHADRKGRDQSQLELLRSDLPGSLMFNYVGAGKTKSKYLK